MGNCMLSNFLHDTYLDKTILNLGSLSGKMLLFGGVYSNLQALEALIAIAERENIAPENCICTGDIVGYCAQPEETVQLFKKWGAKSILGNVEIQLRDNEDNCGCDFRAGSRCDGFSKEWYPYAKDKLSKDSIDFISSLPDHISFRYSEKNTMIVHGSYDYVSEYVFKSTPWEVKERNFSESESQLIIAGHCGLPFYHENEDKLWLNPGVIGMPANDGLQTTWYAILDENGFNHHQLSYDNRTAHKLMLNEKLPIEYARTLITGIWDNTEILPPIESGLQGFGITF